MCHVAFGRLIAMTTILALVLSPLLYACRCMRLHTCKLSVQAPLSPKVKKLFQSLRSMRDLHIIFRELRGPRKCFQGVRSSLSLRRFGLQQ